MWSSNQKEVTDGSNLMEHIRRFEQFIVNAVDETFDWETYLNHEIATYQQYIENLTSSEQIRVLDASGKSSFLSLGLAHQGYSISSVHPINIMLPEALQPYMRQTIKHFQWQPAEKFDVVILPHNAISDHLSDAELGQTLEQIFGVLQHKGILIIATYFYDNLLRLQRKHTPPQQFTIGDKRCIQLELWNWGNDGECSYVQDHFLIKQIGERYTIHNSRTQHRAWRRAEINMILSQTGFVDTQYHMEANNQLLIYTRKL